MRCDEAVPCCVSYSPQTDPSDSERVPWMMMVGAALTCAVRGCCSVDVCPSADFISHTRSSPPSFRVFLRSGRGGGVLRYVSLFVYVNRRVCNSARWTRLKARRACGMSGDKHTRRWDAYSVLVMHFIASNVLGLHTDVPIQQQFWTYT